MCLSLSADDHSLQAQPVQWLEAAWLEWRQEEAQVNASILLGCIVSNAYDHICFSLFSEPAEPHGGQIGTWA